MIPYNWNLKAFNELTVQELYAILQLRNEIFVVEQQCVFQDADNKDAASYHLMCWHEQQLIAYCRLIPAGIAYPNHISIGRVANAMAYRRQGIGKLLMQKAIDHCIVLYGKQPIKIGAQFYLKNFYSSLGFQQTSAIYMEDGIEHIEMIWMPEAILEVV